MTYKKSQDLTIDEAIIREMSGLVLCQDGDWIGTPNQWKLSENLAYTIELQTELETDDLIFNK